MAAPMELPGSFRSSLREARALGRPRPDERVEVTLLLRRRTDRAPYPDVPVTGGFLDREEFAARHGAHPDDLETVRRFAAGAGLQVLAESVGARTMRLGGPVSVAERIFGVVLNRWTYPGGSYRGRLGPIQVPAGLESVIVGVFGLDNRPQAKAHFRRRSQARVTDLSYTPPTVAAAYRFPGRLGRRRSDRGPPRARGRVFARRPCDLLLEPPSCSAQRRRGLGGWGRQLPTGNPDGPDGEVELDLEIVGSVAPAARIAVYFAPNTDQGFLDGLSQAVHDTVYRPSVVSVSWGSAEGSWTPQALSGLNAVCQDAAVLGVTVLAAAGDDGAADGGPGGAGTWTFPLPART